MSDSIDIKKCSRCGNCKAISEFRKDKSKSSGFKSQCSACISDSLKSKRRTQGTGLIKEQQRQLVLHGQKKCSKCNNTKPLHDFQALVDKRGLVHRNVFSSSCKSCSAKGSSQYRAANKNKIKEKQRIYYLENKEKIIADNRLRHAKNRDSRNEKQKEYIKENRAKINIYNRDRHNNNPAINILQRLRNRLNHALKGKIKYGSSMDLFGCKTELLIEHIERLFKPGMSWDNRRKWHIDHKIPCASFDLSDPDQQKTCFHYTNLQPMWAAENRAKWHKITTPIQMTLPI